MTEKFTVQRQATADLVIARRVALMRLSTEQMLKRDGEESDPKQAEDAK